MLSWIIQITIISILFIFLIHHLFEFFKSTLTVPKIKDLVNTPTKKYESMYSTIYNKMNTHTPYDINNMTSTNINDIHFTTDILADNANTNNANTNKEEFKFIYNKQDLLPREEKNMKSELKDFFKKQLNTKKDDNTIQSAEYEPSYFEFK